MSHVLTHFADQLIARLVPALHAQAATCQTVEKSCYCQGPYQYTKTCLVCDGRVVSCKACTATRAFCAGF